MTAMLVTAILAAVIAGIFLKNALHALLLIGLVLGIFFVGCYALDVSPRAMLTEGVQQAHHEYRALRVPTHRREIRDLL